MYIHRVLTQHNEYILYAQSTYSMQIVLTLCSEYLLNETSTYSMQQVLTQYNSYMLYTMVPTLGMSIYSMQRVLTLQVLTPYNEYLLYTTSSYPIQQFLSLIYSIQKVLTRYNKYLYSVKNSTYSSQRVLSLCNSCLL